MPADKGYQGCGPTTPYRKPQGHDLSDVRKACNTALNSVRAAVERAISHLTNRGALAIAGQRIHVDITTPDAHNDDQEH